MIIILGDSWGVGEWGADKDSDCCLTGPGIGQYINMHDTVINLSVGAGSNTVSLNRLEDLLDKIHIDNYDTIYCIVTDPLRCIDDVQIILSQPSIKEEVNTLLNKFLARANSIGERCQKTINLIGGLCDINNIDISNLPYLNTVVPSWGRLLDKNYNASYYSHSQLWNQIGEKCATPEHKLEWINLTKLCDDKMMSMNKLFTTDKSHPTRYHHRILRDFLFPNWKHKY